MWLSNVSVAGVMGSVGGRQPPRNEPLHQTDLWAAADASGWVAPVVRGLRETKKEKVEG